MHWPVTKIQHQGDVALGAPFVLPMPEIQQGLEQAIPQPGSFPFPAKYFVINTGTNSVFSCLQEPFPITSQQTSVNTWGAEANVSICLVLVTESLAPQAESPQFQRL